MACIESCTKGAIEIVDSLDRYEAVIDETKCVNCNLCQNVCQANNPVQLMKPVYWCEGWSNDAKQRATSSSGGYATEIEKAFIRAGGWVCSCVFQDGAFRFALTNQEREIAKFTGSKYVKSDPTGIYKQIRSFLQKGEKVLFVGLPCQVGALKKYLRKEQSSLYTVDLICHGTPSPKILDAFLKDYKLILSEQTSLSFRNNNKFKLYREQKEITVPTVKDGYTEMFLKSVTYTENCYSCPYATLDRVSDVSLGDSWGSNLPKEVVQGGVSFALVQSDKGKELLELADIKQMDTSLECAVEKNHQLRHPSVAPKEREKFLQLLKKGVHFKTAYRQCFPKRYYIAIIKTLLFSLGIKR